MTCHETTQSLGAYVLKSLDVDERAVIDAHLLDCPACAAELAELEELPQFLDRLTIDDVVAPIIEPPADLFDRVAAAARRETERHRLRSRWKLLSAVAAAVIVIAVAVGFGVQGNSHQAPATFAASAGTTHMSVTVNGRASGTDLMVSVDGLPVDEQCKLVAVSRAGAWETAGSWVATYSGTAKVTGSTTIPRGQLVKFVLLGTDGHVLVTVPVSHIT
jgi:anti-sigma factor RsiW